ncbi:MAG: protoporphyrinogen/coproporphyrinogen oxidase [Myxococcota bacterium]
MSDSVLIVGSGISGLSAAVLLARRGVDVEVWEGRDAPGGILAPIEFQGIACDRGSHRVHPESHPLLRELTDEGDWRERPRNGKLVLNGRQIPYPIDPISFLRGLGLEAAVDMGLGWLTRPGVFRRFRRWEDARQRAPKKDLGFEQFVVERVGKSAYRRFYKPYVDKVWGEHPSEISQSVAKQRVSTSNPLQQILRSIGVEKQTFLYPHGGMSGLLDTLLNQAEAAGVTVRYGRRYEHARDSRSGSAAPEGFGKVLYSGYLPDLATEAGLDHRGLYLLHLAFSSELIDDSVDTWYIPETEYWFGRVSQPENFSPAMSADGKAVICVEIPEGRWGEGVDFLERIGTLTRQLVRAGILRRDVEPSDSRQTFLPRIYPLYARNWYHDWERALDDVLRMGDILPIGRQGLFLHCNMDHCVAIADDVVEHVLAGKPDAAWFDGCSDYLDLRVRD